MERNDEAKGAEEGSPRENASMTRRALLKTGLGLGALASMGGFAPDCLPGNPGAAGNPGRLGPAGASHWFEGFLFKDESLVFELIRVLSKMTSRGADLGESLSAAMRIREKEGDTRALLQAWYEEWRKLAERVEKIGDRCLAGGHRVSARDAYFRASEYYRSADFYLHDDPRNPAILELWNQMESCFEKARKLSRPSFETVGIPYEGTRLPAYFRPAGVKGRRAPTLIVHQGFDGTIQETFLAYGNDALERGYNCLVFEGPGQGSVIRKQGLPFRHDWEKVVTPVVDYTLKRKEVDPKRIALMGLSMGGYLAPRAAAFEPRLAACIANPGVLDFWAKTYEKSGLKRNEFKEFLESAPEEYDKISRDLASRSITFYWAVTHGMWVFGAKTPAELALKQAAWTLEDCASSISCPTLVIDSEGEQFDPGQAKKLYEALRCPKTYLLFKAGEGAELHCQAGGALLGTQQIFDWLDETFKRVKH